MPEFTFGRTNRIYTVSCALVSFPLLTLQSSAHGLAALVLLIVKHVIIRRVLVDLHQKKKEEKKKKRKKKEKKKKKKTFSHNNCPGLPGPYVYEIRCHPIMHEL